MFRRILTAILVMAATGPGGGHAADDNVQFNGALVAEPCVIPPGEETIPLEFGSVIDKYLYANHRTQSVDFAIHLTTCDLTIAKTVKVTFSGTPSTALPGLLALDSGSTATGVAIGLENGDGSPLALNTTTAALPLTGGDTRLPFRAYVQGEPAATANRTIGRGGFTATVTFGLDYD